MNLASLDADIVRWWRELPEVEILDMVRSAWHRAHARSAEYSTRGDALDEAMGVHLRHAIALLVRRSLLDMGDEQLLELVGPELLRRLGLGGDMTPAVRLDERPPDGRHAKLVRKWRHRRLARKEEIRRRRSDRRQRPELPPAAPPIELEDLGPIADDVDEAAPPASTRLASSPPPALGVEVDNPVEASVEVEKGEPSAAGEYSSRELASARPRRAPPPAPSRPTVHLPVARPSSTTQPAQPSAVTAIPISDVRAGDDVFACRPLSTKLTARACVSRQSAANAQERAGWTPGKRFAAGGVNTYGACKACPDGRAVAAQIAEAAE